MGRVREMGAIDINISLDTPKNPHTKKRYSRHTNFHLYVPFLRCGFFLERELHKTSYLVVHGRKSFSIFFPSGRECTSRRAYGIHHWQANCSFHCPVYFSGIPPQGLPLRLSIVYHSFRNKQEHFIEIISIWKIFIGMGEVIERTGCLHVVIMVFVISTGRICA